MSDKFALCYLVEGTPKLFHIFVRYDSNGKPMDVDDLKKTIFQDCCKNIADTHSSLILSRIDVDAINPGNHLPLLRFNRGDQGVEGLSPRQLISEIWPKTPPANRIHLFVTFTDLSGNMKGTRKALEAAHHVYYTFWGQGSLDRLLHPVPGRNLKYFPKTLIASLQIRSLSYHESILLVREEYELAFTKLQEEEAKEEDIRSGGMVVTGQPDIGKSCFLYYLLFRLLSLKRAVAFQSNGKLFLFQDTGVQISSTDSYSGNYLPYRIWALSDSRRDFEQPCHAFITAGSSCAAWIVQTTSPSESKWRDWSKVNNAGMYWMDVVTLDEVNALGELLGLNTTIIRDTFHKWGPSARNCTRFAKDPTMIVPYEQDVAEAARLLTKNDSRFTDFSDQATHRILVVRPSPDDRQLRTVNCGTDHLREIVTRAYAEQEHFARYSFYKSIRVIPWFAGPAGELYEIHVLLWLLHAPEYETLPCTGAEAHFPKLTLPSCRTGRKIFFKPQDLAEIGEQKKPMCLIPASRTFPTLDAVVITNNTIITIQMTISPTHDAKRKGFSIIYTNLPIPLLKKRPNRAHLFITDNETNAKSLREQKLKEIPADVLVYSAVANVEDLEYNAEVTYDRLKELKEAKEPPADMMEVTWE